MTIRDMKPGQRGIVQSVDAGRERNRRLYEMGLTPGVPVLVQKAAPFGDPVELRLRGYELSIRREEARRIRVRPLSGKGEEKREELPTALASLPVTGKRRRGGRPVAALAGNPNCGKTTLFNALTGSHQYVGNWPGVTVAKKMGETRRGDLLICDLPGIYSLSPCSGEEEIARDYLLQEKPDVLINIVDGANLERNLYLTLQLMELEIPMVLAVNMADEVASRGWKLSTALLSQSLGIPVIAIAARRGQNIEPLLHMLLQMVRGEISCAPRLSYDVETEQAIASLANLWKESGANGWPGRFWAEMYLEGDPRAARQAEGDAAHCRRMRELAGSYQKAGGGMARLADARYRMIERLTAQCLDKRGGSKKDWTSRIDRVVTGRVFALPIFFLAMLCMFGLTFGTPAKWLSARIDGLFSQWLTPGLGVFLSHAGAPDWCRELLLDAVLGGVGGVLAFLPQIAILFTCLSLLEDSGYMARAAFLMDRLLRKVGLSGKSFIPMLMGFGCTTPAILVARTLEREKDRKLTMLLTPFMSCSARLPVFVLFAGTFFPEHPAWVVCFLYLLGIAVAVGFGCLLKHTVFSGGSAPFLLELPPYRLPSWRTVGRHVWEKCGGFLLKAGTLILAMSIVLWMLQHVTPGLSVTGDASESILGLLGAWLAPLFVPLGFGTWQAAVSLLSGLIAKESVVSTLAVLYASGNAILLPQALSAVFTPASALAFLIFILLYMPCISAFATLKKELGSWREAGAAALAQTAIAYGVSWIGYRLALLL